jgi:hypothetical protein
MPRAVERGQGRFSPFGRFAKREGEIERERKGSEGWCLPSFASSPKWFDFFGNAHKGVGMVHKCFKITKSVMCQSLEIFGTREIGF